MRNHYRVWCEEFGQSREDAATVVTITGEGARDAAQEWARREDRGESEFSICYGRPPVIANVESPDGTVSAWAVRGECVPVYFATEARA